MTIKELFMLYAREDENPVALFVKFFQEGLGDVAWAADQKNIHDFPFYLGLSKMPCN